MCFRHIFFLYYPTLLLRHMAIERTAAPLQHPKGQTTHKAISIFRASRSFPLEFATPEIVLDITHFAFLGAPPQLEPSEPGMDLRRAAQRKPLVSLLRIPPNGLPHHEIRRPEMLRSGLRGPVLVQRLSAGVKEDIGGNCASFMPGRCDAAKSFGKNMLMEVLEAKRNVLRLKRLLPENSGVVQQQAVLNEQIEVVRKLLTEWQRKIYVGTLAPLEDLPIQRELLGLQRELVMISNTPSSTLPSR